MVAPSLKALESSLQLDAALDAARGAEDVVQVLRDHALDEVTKVNLSGKGLKSGDIPSVLRALESAPRMELLNLGKNALDDTALLPLARFLSRHNLRVLNLESADVGVAGAMTLGACLPDSHIEGLVLRGNPLGEGGWRGLAAGLGRTGLRLLSLSNTGGTARSAAALAGVIQAMPLEQLTLSHNALGDLGCEALARVLPQTLLELDFGDTELTAMGAAALGRVLPSHQQLAVLVLERNKLGDDGVAGIVQTLQPGMALRVLNLGQTSLTATGARILADVPWAQLEVRCLELSRNQFGSDGSEPLLRSLGHTRMETLGYADNSLDASAAPALSAMIRNTPLEALDLAHNALGDESCPIIASALPGSTLQGLRLDANGIGDVGAQALAESIMASKLRVLSLADNRVRDMGALSLLRALNPREESVCNLAGNPLAHTALVHPDGGTRDWRLN